MVRTASLATLSLFLVAAPPALARAAGGEIPPEPGLYWEQQVEMAMPGFSMPPQTSKVCIPKKGMDEPPREKDDAGKCQVTDVKRSGSKMSWKMKCEDGTSGEGELTSSPDSFAGTMLMRTQGQEVRMKMKGKKIGGDCDAAEMKRKVAGVQKQAEDAQAKQARAEKEACDEAAAGMKIGFFINLSSVPTLAAQCKDPAKLCANAETRKGLVAFREGPFYDDANRAKVEKLCKKDLAAVTKKHCAEAQKANEKKTQLDDTETLDFVLWFCPDLAKTLAKRECKGRSYTSLPRQQRLFCARWAESGLAGSEEPAPGRGEAAAPAAAAASGKYMKSGIPDVDDAQPAAKKASKEKEKDKKKAADEEDDAPKPKEEDMKSKIFKGIFGR